MPVRGEWFKKNQPGDHYLNGIGAYRKKENERSKNITDMVAEIANDSSLSNITEKIQHANIAEKIRASRNSGSRTPFQDMAEASADFLEKFVLLQDLEVARRLYRGSGH